MSKEPGALHGLWSKGAHGHEYSIKWVTETKVDNWRPVSLAFEFPTCAMKTFAAFPAYPNHGVRFSKTPI